jgi:lipoprotein-anchoring transpeptidase ErfK/SrfK
MKARRTKLKVLATLLTAVLLILPVMPALGEDGSMPPAAPVVTAAVTIGGIQLQNMTAEEASAAIGAIETSFAPLPVVANGRVLPSLNANGALKLDVAATVAAAFAATGTVELTPSYLVTTSTVTAFERVIERTVNRTAVDAKRVVSKRRLKIRASRTGLKVNRAGALSALIAGLVSEASGSGAATVTVPVAVVAPKVTLRNIGKTIIVALGTRRVYLYNGAKIEKTYRCAVGQSRYPTPKGVWKVVAKVKNPAWHNNGGDWAAHMPAYIAPGRNNPLGTRALYLNASGIRIHGIPARENSSIGHAASHGCIRLTNSDAVNIYPRVKVGTPVYTVK